MKRALISVSDKTGIVEFAKELVVEGWDLISTGGTFKVLQSEGIAVREVSDLTGFPEAFDGRVKTLHPKIHGAILYRRDLLSDVDRADELGIGAIDMVVVNLYPFKETYERQDSRLEDMIENIDIGGPTLIRAASKNYKFVSILVDPKDYTTLLEEIKNGGDSKESTRMNLAKKAFGHTAYYDAMIAKYFNEISGDEFPEKLVLSYDKKSDLRYGENPHQSGAFYTDSLGSGRGVGSIVQHNGKELSYNNINDSNEGIDIIKEFSEPTAVVIKHGNPCGVASGETIEEAFKKAYESDSQSIFGGIVILNREVNDALAKFLNRIFLEIVIAPSYTACAKEILARKVNLRILELSELLQKRESSKQIKGVEGGILIQDNDNLLIDELQTVTTRVPTEGELQDLLFAWKVARGAKSNAIVIAKDKVTISVGPGQVSRIWALENATKQGKEGVYGAVLASDGFFPFSDCMELASKSGISAVIQPGGSKNDSDSIDVANRDDIAMVVTGMRHFKH